MPPLLDSNTLKAHALCWLRFQKKMPMVATEATKWNSDVVGVCDEYSIEVEVKVSKSDLNREFKDKLHKHFIMNSGKGSGPNYFYFFVPVELGEYAVGLVEEKAPGAGVIAWSSPPNGAKVDYFNKQSCKVLKKAQTLHDKKPTEALKKVVLLRMGSELCGRRLQEVNFMGYIGDAVKHATDQLVEIIKKMPEHQYVVEDD